MLISVEEIHSFVRRARAELQAVAAAKEAASEDDDRLEEELSHRAEAAHRVLDFCVEAAGWSRDASLLPFLRSMAGGGDDDDRLDQDDAAKVACAVGEILAAGAEVTRDVELLARQGEMQIRLEIARHLRVDQPAALRILESLATTDPWDLVRKAARGRLEGVRDLAWWRGKFTRDPLAGLDDAASARVRGPLEIIAQILDLSEWSRKDRFIELNEAIAELPDGPALDVLGNLLVSAGARTVAGEPALLAQLIRRDREGAALVALLTRWCEVKRWAHGVGDLGERAATRLDTEQRSVAAHRLLRVVTESAHDDELRGRAAALLCGLWPASDDVSPLLDAALADLEQSGDMLDEIAMACWRVMKRADVDLTPIVPRLIEARLAGYPGPWKRAGGWWEGLLLRAPAALLREASVRALASDDPDTVGWALEQKIGPAHDPLRDPAPTEILLRACDEPRLRAAIFSNPTLCRCALPRLREDLRAGRLDHGEAAAVLKAIGALWGGIATLTTPSRFLSPEAREEHRVAARAKIADFLGPASHRGPPTEADWAAWFSLRDLALARGGDEAAFRAALVTLPDGEWHERERALMARAVALVQAGCSSLAFLISCAMAERPDPAWLPFLDALLEADSDEYVVEACDDVRRALGATASVRASAVTSPGSGPAVPSTPPAPTPAREWMDEPDDD